MDKVNYCSKSSIFRKRSTKKRNKMTLLVSLIVLFTIIVGGTIAYIYTKTGDVKNTFTPSKVSCEIVEIFDYITKSDVKIKNTGDTEAYIRARIVVNWIDDNNNISAIKPVLGVDYSLTLSADNTWIKNGDYYYYKSPVAIGQSTSVLIEECKKLPESTEKEGYYLSVEILAEAIQSNALENGDGSWTIKSVGDSTNSNQEVEE